MSTKMTKGEREAFLTDLHVGILAIPEAGRGPMSVPLQPSGLTRATVESLGLRKINSSVERPDTDSVRGMVFRAQHLLEVEEIA